MRGAASRRARDSTSFANLVGSFELGNLMEGPCQRLLWTGPLASLDLLTLFRKPGIGCPQGAPPFQIFIRLTPMRID